MGRVPARKPTKRRKTKTDPVPSQKVNQHYIQRRESAGLQGQQINHEAEPDISTFVSPEALVPDLVHKRELLHEQPPRSISPADKSGSSTLFDAVRVVAKETEDDVDWNLLQVYEELMAKAKEEIQDNRIMPVDLYASEADIGPKSPFVEEVEAPRGQVCCMINDINNSIHPNVVAAKYGVSVLVLIRILARFAQLKVLETTPQGELPELFD